MAAREYIFDAGYETSVTPTSGTPTDGTDLVTKSYVDNHTSSTTAHGATGAVVGTTNTQTLTNKTLTTPVISSISNTGTLTLPTSTDTLVGRATTDTLTNKTLTSPVLNTGVSGTAIVDEDDMVSNSATKIPTQQSVKAYVDTVAGGFGAIQTKTGAYTALTSDGLILCSGAAFTITLYTAVGNANRQILIKKTDATLANIITIDGDGSQTIDGATTTTLNTIGETVRLISDGSNWIILSREIPSTSTAYTPTFTGAGTVTGIGIRWRRKGDSMVVYGGFTTGTVAASVFSLTLPSGATADTTKIVTTNTNIMGRIWWNALAANNDFTLILDQSQPTLLYVGMTDSSTSGRTPNAALNGATLFSSTSYIYFASWEIPISGWNG